MSWLDAINPFSSSSSSGVDWTSTLNGEQVTWLAQHGINPNTLTPQQLVGVKQQMDADIQRQHDATAAQQVAAQEQQRREAEAKALADRLAQEQAAEEQRKRDAEAETTRQATTERQRLEQENAARIQREQLAAEEANRQRLAGLRTAAQTGAQTGARSYFTSRGVDVTPYGQSIDDAITQALASIAPTDESPSSKIDTTGIASRIFSDAESTRRQSLLNQLASAFPETYATTRIADTADDDIINQVLNEQRTGANSIIDNMLRRGVISATGSDAATKELDRQSDVARSRLNTVGADLLTSGRSDLRDIISRGNTAASSVPLGGKFNVGDYTNEVDAKFNEFVNSLGGNFRARAPGNLFDTSSLASIAGSAQGAGNTRFNPNALAGVLEQETDDADQAGNKKTQSRVTDYVF